MVGFSFAERRVKGKRYTDCRNARWKAETLEKEVSLANKFVLTEVIALGQGDQDRAYREKVQRLFEMHGRKMGQVFVELGESESREEAGAVSAKLAADEEWKKLQQERIESGTVVPGTQESFELSSYYP